MTNLQALALGSFMIAAAHYVRSGPDFWYALWGATAVLLLVLDEKLRPALTAPTPATNSGQ